MSRKNFALPVLPSATGTPVPQHAAATGVRIGVVTLGCDKNTVDSERILARLASSGAQVQSGADAVDVVVVNTCGFIDSAKEESIEALLDAVRLKQQGRVRAVVGMGCLVQRYKAELLDELPEVDVFIGLTETDQLVPLLRERGLIEDPAAGTMERPLRMLSTTTPHTSYLKISEGCDHTCAFCAIPLMRGKHRSTPMDTLVREAQELEQAGVVELNIISQDTTWYGRDLARGVTSDAPDFFVGKIFDKMPNVLKEVAPLRPFAPPPVRNTLLPDLLKQLLAETTIPWFRLFYMYPSGITRELVELIAAQPRLLPYLDMPLQHGSDRMLKKMRRPERQRTIRQRVAWLRDAVPELALRTTLIVGFPGETEEDFAELLELVEEIRFDHIGAFPYSPEEGTLAAEMPAQVPGAVKRERLEQLLDLQRSITLENNEARVGRRETVLLDRVGRRGAVGRTRSQALEVDGVVRLPTARDARPGQFVQVQITKATEHDLAGEIVGDEH